MSYDRWMMDSELMGIIPKRSIGDKPHVRKRYLVKVS